MSTSLAEVLSVLRGNQPELRRRGVLHAAVFGSVARGEAHADSDVDVLVELDPDRPMGVFEYVAIGLRISELIGREADLVMKDALQPPMRRRIIREAVDAF